MQIPMSYKVEAYQESLFMGFPLKQSLHMLAGMAVMAAVIAIMTMAFNIHVVIATYIGLPFAAPIVIAGFPDSTGMTIIDKRRKMKEIKSYGKTLAYGTGLNEVLIRTLEKEGRAASDAFDSTIRRLIVIGIVTGVIIIAAIIIIIMTTIM